MKHLLFFLLIIFLNGCVNKPKVYDPFSRIKPEEFGSWYESDPISPDLVTPERRQIDSFRYWDDMEEAEELMFYQGLAESYRFIFWGDHEPYILVRINRWEWNNKYSLSLRVRMRDAYNATSCIYDPKQVNPLDCPKTDYARKENYEVTEEQWQQFKEKLDKLDFFSYKPSTDEDKITILHGTLWSFEGILETENDILENRFEVNTPPEGDLYQVGKYLLESVGEQRWLARTKR